MSKSRVPAFKSTAPPVEVPLSLHSEVTLTEHEEEVGWVRWIFQSIRARREALVFQSAATERTDLIEDWKRFIDRTWLPSGAPLLLRAWSAAREGKEEELFAVNGEMGAALSAEEQERSVTAGQMLLRATQGAKYQAALGTFPPSSGTGWRGATARRRVGRARRAFSTASGGCFGGAPA